MRGFTSVAHAQRFLAVHGVVLNLFSRWPPSAPRRAPPPDAEPGLRGLAGGDLCIRQHAISVHR